MSNEQTRLSVYIKKLQDHPVISLIIFFCLCLMAISAFITQMDSGYSTISKRVSPPPPIEEQANNQEPEIPSKPKKIEEKNPSQVQACQECDEIFAKGMDYITQAKISKPSGNNAYESYLELKQIDTPLAEKLLEAITFRMRQLVQSEIKNGNLSNANKLLDTLSSIDSSHDTSDLLISITKRRIELLESPSPEAKIATKIARKEPTPPKNTVNATSNNPSPNRPPIIDSQPITQNSPTYQSIEKNGHLRNWKPQRG